MFEGGGRGHVWGWGGGGGGPMVPVGTRWKLSPSVVARLYKAGYKDGSLPLTDLSQRSGPGCLLEGVGQGGAPEQPLPVQPADHKSAHCTPHIETLSHLAHLDYP